MISSGTANICRIARERKVKKKLRKISQESLKKKTRGS
jgi:hypothetical protein